MARNLRSRVISAPHPAAARRRKVLKSSGATTTKKAAKKSSARKSIKEEASSVIPSIPIQPKPKRIRKAKPHKNAIPTPEPIQPTILPNAPYLPPKNPQATFLGLPAEVSSSPPIATTKLTFPPQLRLQIYAYLHATTLIHIHKHVKVTKYYSYVSKQTWTPCKAAHPTLPLCAHPKYSGLCPESDRCTVRRDQPLDLRGLHALALTSKFVRSETAEFRAAPSTIAIPFDNDAAQCLATLRRVAPRKFAAIRRLVVVGVETDDAFFRGDANFILDQVPQLEALGVQFQAMNHARVDVLNESKLWLWCRGWRPLEWAATLIRTFPQRKAVPRHLTVVLEGTVWVKGLNGKIVGGESRWTLDKQIVVRIVREGKGPRVEASVGGPGEGWSDKDVRFEVVNPGGLVEPKRNAAWKAWW